MSTQSDRSNLADFLVRSGNRKAAVLAFCRFPKIRSITWDCPDGDGLRVSLFDLDHRLLYSEKRWWRANVAGRDNVSGVINIPERQPRRMLIFSMEYNEQHTAEAFVYESRNQPRTRVKIVFDNGKTASSVLEESPNMRNIPCPSNGDGTRVINYMHLFGGSKIVPKFALENPLNPVEYGISEIWKNGEWQTGG